MGEYVVVGKTGEFKDGSKKKIVLEGQEILLARVGNDYYAVSNRCPHLKGDLSLGKLEGTVVTCPRHGSQFDIRDGKNVRWLKGTGIVSAIGKALKSPRDLTSYNVKIEDDTISVGI